MRISNRAFRFDIKGRMYALDIQENVLALYTEFAGRWRKLPDISIDASEKAVSEAGGIDQFVNKSIDSVNAFLQIIQGDTSSLERATTHSELLLEKLNSKSESAPNAPAVFTKMDGVVQIRPKY